MNIQNNLSLCYCNCIFYTITLLLQLYILHYHISIGFQETSQLTIAGYINATCSHILRMS